MSAQNAGMGDIEGLGSGGLTHSKDGVLLQPQPTRDPLDPLNWTRLRKNSILGIVMGMYFMFTYITTTTVPSFPELQKKYSITYSQVNLTVAIPSLGLAFGPLFWSSLSDIYGRRIIFLIGTAVAFLATIGTVFSENYSTYMLARAFQGFGASPGGTVGMAIINDLFFDYERGGKLGLWILAINCGLLAGPIIGGFIDLISQNWVNILTGVFFAALLLVELFFLPETLYPRSHMLGKEADNAQEKEIGAVRRTDIDESVQLKRTTDLRFINLSPIPGIRHPKPWDSVIRFRLTFKFSAVTLTVIAFCFLWYWWIMSIITFIPAAYTQYSPSIQGLLFSGLLLGSLFSELFCSGRLSDWLVHRLNEGNGRTRVPETRLWLVYPAALLSSMGLILWGISVDRHYHWMVGQVAFFFFTAGLQTGNTVISSYIVDCYPLQSMSIITFYSVVLDISALSDPFFIAAWISGWGYTKVFAAQGIITIFVFIPLICLVHKYGPSLRAKSGEPSWVNPESATTSTNSPFLSLPALALPALSLPVLSLPNISRPKRSLSRFSFPNLNPYNQPRNPMPSPAAGHTDRLTLRNSTLRDSVLRESILRDFTLQDSSLRDSTNQKSLATSSPASPSNQTSRVTPPSAIYTRL